MKRFGLVFFVTALLLSEHVEAASVTCYVCSGSSACNLNLSLNTETGCTVCKKTEINGAVTRSCVLSLFNIYSRSCTISGGVTECYCNTDYCNSGWRMTFSVSTLVLSVVAAYFGLDRK
ncbi:uncharacterized protein LOC127868158 [Dreissena polymorpha]|uniref:Uncharacterized protein n=1 Tax=Dreissena polymorpha TaxID=45954 RepID=A0A9D4N1S7_DREPO|nr:uncharacterized protein LOC127868158 [Dreissena polymorpha]KAH3886581.1 hypothetical protein DPMN_010592 [Dreissena polymorpha]